MAYLELDDLKAYLGLAITEPEEEETNGDDALLEGFIVKAQATIDRHCGQSFEAADDSTRTFYASSIDGGGAIDGRDLILDAPLASLTSVTNGDGEVVSASDTLLLPPNGTPKYAIRLKVSSGLFWTYADDVESDVISVVGKWAFSEEAPADIVHAATRLAAWYYRQRDNAMDLDRTVIVGDTTLLPGRIPADVLTLLAPYVRGPG